MREVLGHCEIFSGIIMQVGTLLGNKGGERKKEETEQEEAEVEKPLTLPPLIYLLHARMLRRVRLCRPSGL